MDTIGQIESEGVVSAEDRGFVVDTTFVLFFLAFDCGQRFEPGIGGFLSGLTLAAFLILPYFLPFSGEKPNFDKWVMGRTAIATLALLLGYLFGRSLGIVVPEAFGFLPFTLLIVVGMVSCYIQLINLFRVRLAK